MLIVRGQTTVKQYEVLCAQCCFTCVLQSLAHVLAAMAPCARLYAYLGCQLVAARPGAYGTTGLLPRSIFNPLIRFHQP